MFIYLYFSLTELIMASNKGLSKNEILDLLYPEDDQNVDLQPDAEECENKYNVDSDDGGKLEGAGHPLCYLSGSDASQGRSSRC